MDTWKELTSAAKARKQNEEQKKKQRTDTWNDLRREAIGREVDDKYIQSYLTDSQNYFTQAQNDYAGLSWKTGSDKAVNDKRKAAADDLQSRSRKIRAFYTLNKDALGADAYNGMMEYLDSTDGMYGSTLDDFAAAYDFYSQWESEDLYMRDNAFYEKYGKLTQNEDYALHSAANRNTGAEEAKNYVDYAMKYGGGSYVKPGTNQIEYVKDTYSVDPMEAPEITDKLGFYLYRNNDTTTKLNRNSVQASEIMTQGHGAGWDQMTDEQIADYYYLFNTQGKEAADQYLEDIAFVLRRDRYMAERAATIAEYENATGAEKAWMSAKSIPAQFAANLTANLERTRQAVTGDEWKPYTGMQYASNVRQLTAAELDAKYGKIPWVDFSAGDAYQALMSGADSGFNALMSGGMAIGKLGGAGARALGSLITSSTMGGSAYFTEAQRLYEQGATQEQIVQGATAAATIETLTEMLPLDNLFKVKDGKTILKFFKNAAKQAGIEGLEEVLSGIGNTAANHMIMKDDSDWSKLVEQTGSKRGAVVEVLRQAASDFLGGALSGALGGNLGAIGPTVSYGINQRNVGSEIQQRGLTSALTDLAHERIANADPKTAKQLQRMVDRAGKKTTSNNVGKLYNAMNAAEQTQVQKATVAQLQEAGIAKKDANILAEAMVRQANSEMLTDEQSEILDKYADNATAQKVFDSVWEQRASIDQQMVNHKISQAVQTIRQQLEEQGVAPETAAQLAEMAVQGTADQQMENAQEVAAAAEGEQLQSAEGQVLYEDQPVQMGKIKSAGNGPMIVQLADGASVDASKLSFPDQGQQELYQIVGKIADSAGTANLLLAGLDEGNASAGIYARAVEQAFFYGRHQIPLAQLQAESPFAQALTPKQLEQAYALGVMAGKKAAENRDAVASKGNPRKNRKGSVNYGYEGQALDKSKLKLSQKVGVDFAERLAKKYGMTTYFYRSYVNENGERVYKNKEGMIVPADESGHYDPSDGSIHIDLNCGDMGDSVMFTIAHELTHFIQDWSPTRYRKLCSILMGGFAQSNQSVRQLILHKQNEYRKKGVELTAEQAYDEVIASSMEGVLTDGRVMDLLDQVETIDQSLWDQIKSFFENVADMIRDTIQAYKNKKPDSPEGRIVQRMDHLREQLQNAFAIGLSKGGYNYQRGGEINTVQAGMVRYEISYSDAIDRIEEGTLDRSNNTHLKLLDHTPQLYINKAGAKDLKVIAGWDIVYLAMKKTGDLPGNYHGLGPEIMKEIPNAIKDPLYIVKQHNGRIAAITEIVVKGNRSVFISLELDAFKSTKQDGQNESENYNLILTFMDAKPNYLQNTIFNGEIVYNKNNETPANFILRLKSLKKAVPNDDLAKVSNNSIDNPDKKVNKKSVRYQMNAAAQEHLQAATGDMGADVDALKQLVSMLNKQTGMNRLKHGTLDAAASFLMRTAGARGDKQQLMRMLNEFYSYVGQTEGLSWESIQQEARPIAQWLTDHMVRTKQMSEYAAEVLDTVRHSRIYLDDAQRKEVEYAFGSYGAYRSAMMGSVVLANDRSISLDTQWQEWAGMYPDVFDEDMNATDMPGELMNIIQRMRNSDTSELEFEYNRDFIIQDLTNRVYDSYWNAATLYVVADQYEQKIRQLKGKHKQHMAEVYQRHRDAEAALRQEFKRRTEALQAHYEERYQRRESEYRDSRRNAVERHDKAQIRQQIRKDVERLASLLNKGNKQKNVKQELQAFAGAALRTAQGTFLNNYNEYDMIRNGVHNRLMNEHQPIFDRCRELLKELDKLRDEKNLEPGATSMHDKWDPEAALRREDREEALKKELAKNMAILRNANVFRTENEGLQSSTAEELMNELLNAYGELKKSKLEHVRGVYSQVIYDQIDSVKKFLAGKAVKDMTMVELKELQKMYRLVLHTVTTSNELFAQKRKADVRKLGEEIITQLQDPGKPMTPELLDRLKKMGWSMLKPETALELIGSDTLTEMMQGLYRGEDTYALDIDHARRFAQEQGEKYGRKNWKLDEAVSFAGTKITLGQAMSLYAYTKRQQAQGHLEGDGFTQASNVRIKKALGKLPLKLKYIMNATKTHVVSKEMYAKVADLLTPQQRKYVDAMQEYLSKTMGAKGNEVSRVLYGIDLFNEQAYFPLKTASEYHDEALGATTGEVKLKNTGFTNKVQEGAKNPIVLDDFESVWSAHVDKMSLYHGFVLPMEDFDRVYNYHRTAERDVTDAEGEVYKTELVDTNETVKVDIENKVGKAANAYIEQFMQQLNGGVRGDSTEKLFGGLIRNFKKTAVLGSLSVAIQQPTAFIRAMAYLDIQDIADWKNWLGKAGKPDGKLVEEMYKYAPVALMKKIGGFDPGLGRTSQEYMIKNKRSVLDTLENALGMLPEKMDEWTWTYIWLCSKRQIHRQHPDLRVGSKEFCEKAGELFSKIIRDTQVYDSVLVKSQIMRSKNIFLQMATSFMNEPMTSMDMYIRSTLQAKQGKLSKGKVARTYAAVIGSQILCAALASFVYAARDDDEDETYWEKYLSSFVGKTKEGILPWYSIPFVKDIFSIFKGYDVERSDMSIIADIYQGWKKLQSDDATAWEKTEAFAGSIMNLFGIPLKNVSRDIRGIYNTVDHMVNPRTIPTKAGLRYAAKEGITGKETPKTEQMYNAVVDNDAAHILRLMATYNTEDSAQAAVCTAVKDSYVGGKITEERALDMLQIYGGVDQTDAQEKVMYYEFKKQHPDSELHEAAALKWYTQYQNDGISLEIYTEYCTLKKGYTKKADIMEVIDSLDLTRAQKDALYYGAGYAESTIDEAPWH